MRVLLVGSAGDRARLRRQLEAGPIEIVGEFLTMAGARRAAIDADAIMLASDADAAGEYRVDRYRTQDPDGLLAAPAPEPLTPREHDVLALVAEGRSNKAIADELGISDQTVKFHVASIIGKLGATNRTDAVRRAVRRGLIVL